MAEVWPAGASGPAGAGPARRRVAFAIPGDLTLPTGGYAYDREVLARLPAHGIAATHVPLPGSFPAPAEGDLATTERLLAATAPGTLLLIDGLAYGVFPPALVQRLARTVVALCHHPLGLESGLAEDRVRDLVAQERAALGVAAHVIVTSRATARLLTAEFAVPPAKITVAEPGTARAPRASGTGSPVTLLAVGSVVPRKGYDVLVDALSTAASLDWELAIAGALDRDPATAAALRARIAASGLDDKVRLLGAVDDATLAELYDRADVFVLASRFEGYGMALTEAMARGLAIVTTTGGASAETVPDAAAIKVAPGDAAGLAGALRDVIASPAIRCRLAEAAWTAVRDLPTWDDTARTIARVLEEAGR